MDRSSDPDVTVQIVSYNSGSRIIETLRALEASVEEPLRYEVIIVDNCSKDGSRDLIRHTFPLAEVIENDRNRYFSAGHNQAAAVARGRYLLVLNSDITLTKGIMNRLVAFLDVNHGAGAVSPGLYPQGRKDGMDCVTWDLLTLSRVALLSNPQYEVLVRLGLMKAGQGKHIASDGIVEVEVVSDACLLIRRGLFHEIGGYDEHMRLYCTEDDLCRRVRERGYRIFVLPFLKAYHVHGFTTGKSPRPVIARIAWKDKVSFFRKAYGRRQAVAVWLLGGIDYSYFLLKEIVKAGIGRRVRP